MARDIGDELFRPLVREVRDLNVRMGPSSDVVRKLKRKKGDDRGRVTDMDRFDGEAPSATSRPRDGGRNDGRDARGRFVAAQRLFDGAVSVETPAVANLPDVRRINIVQVVLERVP